MILIFKTCTGMFSLKIVHPLMLVWLIVTVDLVLIMGIHMAGLLNCCWSRTVVMHQRWLHQLLAHKLVHGWKMSWTTWRMSHWSLIWRHVSLRSWRGRNLLIILTTAILLFILLSAGVNLQQIFKGIFRERLGICKHSSIFHLHGLVCLLVETTTTC